MLWWECVCVCSHVYGYIAHLYVWRPCWRWECVCMFTCEWVHVHTVVCMETQAPIGSFLSHYHICGC